MKVVTLLLALSAGLPLAPLSAGVTPSSRLVVPTDLASPAERFTDTRLIPTNFVGRLIVRLPANLAQTPEAINGAAITALSLASMAMDPALMQDAWVSFDSQHQMWKAMWPKPPMFHYGMVLLPALVQKLASGQSFTFESQGQPATLVKDGSGQLLVQRKGVSSPLSAGDLRDLLRARINAEGMSLFLDNSGNLILQATGDRAVALSNTAKSTK